MKKGGKGNPARHHEIRSDTNVRKLKMSDILAHSKTKKALTFLLASSVNEHLQQQNKMFVVAHDIEAPFSLGHDANYKSNINHEEADTMLIYCLANCPLSDLPVRVYCIDTDVCALLLKHLPLINCSNLYMDLKRGTINLTDVHKPLGVAPASALLGLYCITDGDKTGSFNKKGKRSWVQIFFKNLNNNNLMNVLANFPEFAVEDSLPELAEFICRGYISKLPSEQEK